jgi:hypothetical protein
LRQRALGKRKARRDVEVKRVVEILCRGLEKRGRRGAAGIVDEQVEAPEPRGRLFDDTLGDRQVGEIARNCQDLSTQTARTGGDAIQLIAIACYQHQV